MIKLYALKQSRAYRISWLLELLELDYQLEIIERDRQTFLAPDRLRQIHPLGKSPLITDGELTLGESGAIVEYLLQRYDHSNQLKPLAEDKHYPDYLYWLHYAEGSIMPLLIISLILKRVDQQKMPFFIKPIAQKITHKIRGAFLSPQLTLHLTHIEQSLVGKTWFLGEQLTGADVMMSFPLQALVIQGLNGYPNIRRYVQQIQQHPAYQQAEQKIGKLTI